MDHGLRALGQVEFDRGRFFEAAAAFTARMVEEIEDVPLPGGTLLNVNFPGGEIAGVPQLLLTRPAGTRRRPRPTARPGSAAPWKWSGTA